MAEAWRNLVAEGAKPLALTDNLNFGNPEKPEAMGQFVGCLRGIGEAARRSISPSCPAMSRSTTRPWAKAFCPRPPSAASGWWPTSRLRRRWLSRRGRRGLLIGGEPGWLGCSAMAPSAAAARTARRRRSISRGAPAWRVRLGVDRTRAASAPFTTSPTAASRWRSRKWRWGRRRRRASGGLGEFLTPLVRIRGAMSSRPRRTKPRASSRTRRSRKVPVERIGVTGGDALIFAGEPPVEIAELRRAFESFLPKLMEGQT